MSVWRHLGWGTALVAGLAVLFGGCEEQATTGPKLGPVASVVAASASAGHVVLVTEENTNASSVTTSSMPYLMGLAAQYGMATRYYANTHPSIGNYFELATGQVLTNDDNSSTIQTVDNVVRELVKSGKTWKSYAEDLPSVGYTGGDVGNYARKHNVFALLSDVVNSAAQVGNLVPFSQFASDLKNGTLPNFSNIVPNLCNDAHDCSLGTADSWLKANIAPLLASPAFQAGGDGVLIVTFDESASDNANGGGRVAWVVVSPQAKQGYQSTTTYQHPSTLRLVLSALGVSTFPGAAASAPAMDEFFGSTVVTPPPLPTGTYYSTNFADGTTGPLEVYTNGGNGTCAKSTAYHDAGSAYGMACTVTQSTGEAALQAWFGNGKLASTPKDPSLNQDLFEQTRFVLGPGALKAIGGGTTCSVAGAQFKTHKSVYGQVGSNVNGWVMSAIGPCSDPSSGKMFTEPELWGTNGVITPWPTVLQEGVVYDVVYRYHRYTSQNCGTVAVWVNGTKVEDSPCASYLGATNGSTEGLLFWDGATYLQSGVSPLTIYTLFAAAANTPLGAGVASGGPSTPPPPPSPTGTCQTSAAAWWGTALSAPQTGSFTAEFDATPSGGGVDGVIGLGPKIATGYTDMATIVRFNVNNAIDARNGGTYTAASTIPYTAGTSYHFRLVVSLGTHTYAAYVRPAGGVEATIGTGYAFRTEQAAVSSVGYWSLESDYTSTVKVCNVTVGGSTTPPPPVAVSSVTVTPAAASVTVGKTAQFSAVAKDSTGTVLTNQTFTWGSSASTVATVNSSGLLTAVAAGSTTLTATDGGKSGTATVTVTAAPVAPVVTVTVAPSSASLTVGQTLQLSATEKDANGNLLTGRTVTWASSNAGSVSVTGSGLVTAQAAGSATITATSETVKGTASVSVTAPVATGSCGNTGSGKCWYVATSGNDGNAGTSSAPLRTLQKAASVVSAGDGVLVGDGVYTGGITISASGTSANWIVFKAAHKWAAVIDGNNFSVSANVSVRGNYIRIEGFDIRRSDRGGIEAYNGNELQATNHDVAIVGNHIHDIGRICTDDTGGRSGVEVYASNVTVDGNLIENIGRLAPGEQGCSPSSSNYQNHDHGVYAAVGDNTLITNNVFYNCLRGWPVHRYSGGGATMNGFVIANNTFSDGNPWKAGQIIIGGKTNGLVIENNIFNQPTTAGIWYDAGDGGTWSGAIQRNNLSTTAIATGASIGAGGDLANTTPLFAGTRDYHEQSGSPSVNRGLSLANVLMDYDGVTRPQGGAYDIGAYER